MAEIKLKDAPAEARPFHQKGLEALERSNLDYAMDMFAAALAVEPRLLEVRRLLRSTAIRKTEKNPPSRLDRLKAAAAFLKIPTLSKKNKLKGLEAAELTLDTDPLNPKLARAFCSAALAADLPEAAVQTLEILKQHNRADLASLEMLADLYRKSEQFQLEFESREKIAMLSPNDTIAAKQLKDAAARLTMEKSDWKTG